MDQDDKFDDWIRELDEDVIQGEFGYELGEFSVFSDQWRPLYDEGLTPGQAWQRALNAHCESNRESWPSQQWLDDVRETN